MIKEHIPNTSVDTTVVSYASRGIGGGATATVFGWLMSNEVLAFVGITIAILSFVINFIFQRRRDRREEREAQMREELHKAQLAAYKTNE